MQLLIIGINTIVIAVLEEYVFSASRHFWIGGIVPILWTLGMREPPRVQIQVELAPSWR